MKKILFIREGYKPSKGYGDYGLRAMEVNTEVLEGTARKLAELIYTTENGDDLSKAFIRSDKTNEELMREEGKSEEDIKRFRRGYGDHLDYRPCITWTWDRLQGEETTEEYFNRHAKEVDRIGGKIEGNWINRCVSR